jgi:NADPH-dependent 2,4-dienoyl-CoA reductase/sulfur reductase-like enzyme
VRIVIAGAGMAGLYTATALREGGYSDELVLIGAERHKPYDRPPLSKEVLSAKNEDSFFEADYDALDLDLRLGAECTGIEGSTLTVDGQGGDLEFDRLVVATGSNPIWLPGSEGTEGCHVIRTLDDSLRLRSALQPGKKVVVIGAGWIGAEVATTAANAGCDVTVVEALGHPLAAAMPKVIGDITLPWYDELGVHLLLNTVVDSVERGAVHLVGGQTLQSDATVIGVGVRPATAWVGDALDRTQRGAIIVDAHCRTSRPDIYAVGDCTIFPSKRYGMELHVEHWDNAAKQPSVAAASILGEDKTYDPVPYFWSNQFGRMIQYVGHHNETAELIWRGEPTEAKWSAMWVEGDQLLAAIGSGRPRDVIQARMLMEAGTPVDSALLADVSVGVSQAGVAVSGA